MSRLNAEEQTPRQRIIEGAKHAFLTFGYDGASMRTISEFTGYSQAGISHYFATKSDLVITAFAQACKTISASFNVDTNLDSTSRLCHIWQNMARHRTDAGMWCVLIAEASTAGHPTSEMSKVALLDFDTHVKETFPEIEQPELMTDIWIGLVTSWLYFPTLDVPDLLEQSYIALTQDNQPWHSTNKGPGQPWDDQTIGRYRSLVRVEDLSPSAESRKNEIIRVATEVFGNVGYVQGSLRTIAAKLGITHPALLRHYPKKKDLFKAVLQRQDLKVTSSTVPGNVREALTLEIERLRQAILVPGLVQVFTTAIGRSFEPTAAFHEFFVQRMGSVVELNIFLFEELFEQGLLRENLDPTAQARIYSAAWLGALVRWSLDSTCAGNALSQYLELVQK